MLRCAMRRIAFLRMDVSLLGIGIAGFRVAYTRKKFRQLGAKNLNPLALFQNRLRMIGSNLRLKSFLRSQTHLILSLWASLRALKILKKIGNKTQIDCFKISWKPCLLSFNMKNLINLHCKILVCSSSTENKVSDLAANRRRSLTPTLGRNSAIIGNLSFLIINSLFDLKYEYL